MKSWSPFHGGLMLVLLLSLACALQGRRLCFEEWAIRHVFAELASLSRNCKTPAWPPATPTYHMNVKTKRFALDLQPVIVPSSKYTSWKSYWLRTLQRKYRGRKPSGSWFRQVVTMQRKLGSKVTGKNEYDYYPPAVNVQAIVNSMRKGEIIQMPPIDDPHIELVRYPVTCSPKDHKTYDLIVAARSCVTCAWYRRMARRTFMKPNLWKGMRVGFFFFMGMPAPQKYRVINFEGLRIRQRASLPGRVSQAQATRDLLREANKYNDMLIGNYWDEMYNMTLGTIMGFRWTSLYCTIRSPLFLFLVDSYTIVPEKVKAFVNRIPAASKPNYYGGRVHYRMRITRAPTNKITPNPWAVSRDELPWVYYPNFASGVALFLGREQLKDVTISMMFTKRFRLSDVFIGINFYRLNRKPKFVGHLHFHVNAHSAKSAMGSLTHNIINRINWNTGRPK